MAICGFFEMGLWWFLRWVCGDGGGGFFFFFLNHSSSGLVVVMAVDGYDWVGLVVVMWGLWVCGLVLARSSNLWVAMVVLGLAVAGVGYWFAGFVGLFMVVLPSKKERETRK